MILRRLYNWIRRFPHRCGYGVHSPSDFYLITFVIYESLPYYKYKTLKAFRPLLYQYPHHREKVDRFFLRFANYLQLSSLLEVGTGSGLSACYLSAGNEKMRCVTINPSLPEDVLAVLSSIHSIENKRGGELELLAQYLDKNKLDLVHIGYTPLYKEIWEMILPHVEAYTCVLVSHPYADSMKKQWWKSVIADSRVTVSFDLYDVGILFFNPKRCKEHRIVNFF